jgi:ribose transport system permease protein
LTPITMPRARRVTIPSWGALLLVLLAEMALFGVTSPYFFSWDNFVNIVTTVAVAGIVASAATLLIVGGQFDLSVGSGVAATSFVLVSLSGTNIVLAITASIVVGLLIGLLNGVIVTVLRVNAFIATLGTLALLRGLVLVLGHSNYLFIDGFDWATYRPVLNVPLGVWVFLAVAVIAHFVMQRTVFGRQVFTLGSNPVAARLVGISSRRTVIGAFMLSGLCMAIAGLVLSSQLASVSGGTGIGLEISVITAVILGGTRLSGGLGTITGTVIGLAVVAVLGNGLTLLNIEAPWQQVATGTLLILAVAVDQWREAREAS